MLSYQFLVSSLLFQVWNILFSQTSYYCFSSIHLLFLSVQDLGFKYVIPFIHTFFFFTTLFIWPLFWECFSSLFSSNDFLYTYWFYFRNYIFHFSMLYLIWTNSCLIHSFIIFSSKSIYSLKCPVSWSLHEREDGEEVIRIFL